MSAADPSSPWHTRWSRCQSPWCATPDSPHLARGLCRCCYHVQWRDAHPATAEQRRAAVRRAQRSRLRRLVAERDEARGVRQKEARRQAWWLARGL